MTRTLSALAVLAALCAPAAAQFYGPGVPNFDVSARCAEVQGSSGVRSAYEACTKGEEAARRGLVAVWPTLSASSRQWCSQRAAGSYAALWGCIAPDRERDLGRNR